MALKSKDFGLFSQGTSGGGGGGVTSVSGTSPITSSGGTTPIISTSMSTNKLIGRSTAGTGVMEEITVGAGLTLSGGTLTNTATPTPLGYYGAWQDNVTQTAPSSNVGVAMIFRTVDLSNGVTVVTNGTNLTRITFANTGVYNLQFSSQFQNTSNQLQDVTIWLRLNGNDVAGSSGYISVPNSHGGVDGHIIASWNYLLNVVAGDYYELVWSTTLHTAVTMQYYAAGSPPPSTASVILSVTQQSGIMAGTGITAINSLTGAVQTLTTGTTGTDFAIVDSGTDHKFNLPTASASNRGALSSADWTTFNGKVGGSGTTGAIVKLTASTTIGDATADVDYMQQDDIVTAMQLMGSSIKGVSLVAPNPMMNIASTLTLATGALQIVAIYIQKTQTLTGIRWYQATNGNYVASNYNGVGLYTQSGGTLTLVASSTNDGNVWQQGAGSLWRNKAFSSTYTASRGIYYIGALYSTSSQTTAPGIGGVAASAGAWANLATVDFTNNERLYAGLTAQTTLTTPVALSSFNTGNNARFAFYTY